MKQRTRDDGAVILAFGKRLRELRESRPHPVKVSAFMPQNVAAARAGLDGSYWGRLERGECDPTLTSLLRIQQGLGLDSIETLLGQTGSEKLGVNLRHR
jgi:transcriptional regulator with XRE-family HTH domain